MISKFLSLLVIFLANTIQTITGFAGNLLAMPPLIKLVGIETAKMVMNVFTMVACGIIGWQNRKYIQIKIFIKMLVIMFIGMGIGTWLFEIISFNILLQLYGIMIILIAVKKLFIKKEFILPSWFMLFILLCAGIIHGMFLSGGALLVVYAVSVIRDKNEFRATVAPIWTVLDFILIFSHISLGYYTFENVVLLIISMIPLALSIKIGNYMYDKISQKTFLQITYILLIISGITALV